MEANLNMSRVDQLPPDQRAALSVLLRAHKSYAEVAGLLGIAERAVHDRAQAGSRCSRPRRRARSTRRSAMRSATTCSASRTRASGSARARCLAGSQPASDWARAVAAEIAPLADGALPELPAGPGEQPGASPLSEAATAPAAGPPPPPPSSRRGGALLLGGIVIVAAVVAIVLSVGGSRRKGSSTAATRSTRDEHQQRARGAKITMHPPNAGSR